MARQYHLETPAIRLAPKEFNETQLKLRMEVGLRFFDQHEGKTRIVVPIKGEQLCRHEEDVVVAEAACSARLVIRKGQLHALQQLSKFLRWDADSSAQWSRTDTERLQIRLVEFRFRIPYHITASNSVLCSTRNSDKSHRTAVGFVGVPIVDLLPTQLRVRVEDLRESRTFSCRQFANSVPQRFQIRSSE
jgi:hypothetical protein